MALVVVGQKLRRLRGMWGLPRPGIKPAPPALVDGFVAMDHQGSPTQYFINIEFLLRVKDGKFDTHQTLLP